jgi:hypothetical protein
MDDSRKHRILDDKIAEANKYTHNVRKSQIEFIREGMKGAEEFYYKLAVISAGTITFSVSFVSYVSTTNSILSQTWLLFTSWILLLLSLFGSLYRNHFHSNFLHYQLQKEWLVSKIDAEELAREMLEKYPETVYNAFEGIENLIKISNDRKAQYTKAKKHNENKEKIYDFLWTNCLRVAHVGFVLGMLCMVLFAIANLK